ncbi:MAG: exopolysaccharide biosynthesis polyprenyl glycosylphosphotransferase [Candidatus Magasanikbacteria bacterium]
MKHLYRFKQLILATGDVSVFFIAFCLSLVIRYAGIPSFELITKNIQAFFFAFLLWIVVNYINGLYDVRLIHSDGRYKRIIEAALFSLIVGVIFFYIRPDRDITPKTILILTVIIGYTFAALWRILYNSLIGDKKLQTSVIFVGIIEETNELIQILNKEKNIGYYVPAIFDISGQWKSSATFDIEMYHDVSQLENAIKKYRPQVIVTSAEAGNNAQVVKTLYHLLFSSIVLTDLFSFYETVTGRISPATFSESWFLKNIRSADRPVYDKLRRLIDIIIASALSFVLGLILIIIAPLIKLTSKGPLFFKQERIGQNGKLFWIYKLRTMHVLSKDGSAETAGFEFAKKDDKRITPIGKMLRKSRIDELPQVLNLFKGDITFIGPRPERPEIVEKLTEHMPYYPLRETVKPGITGWAQIHQHYTDTLETSLQKLQYDLFYIKNRSFLLDLSILLKTINVVMRGMGQ